MRIGNIFYLPLLALFCFFFSACEKETIKVTDNELQEYNEIPSLLLSNYVNRAYIDLIGREPVNSEMDDEVVQLKETNAAEDTRLSMLVKLQSSTDFVPGDSSFKKAYYHWFYESAKARTLEGASKTEITQPLGNFKFALEKVLADSIFNQEAYDRLTTNIEKIENLIDAEEQYENGEIDIAEVYARMINNAIYDNINMNSFNFINAVFDNLLFRFPTESEFDQAYEMVEFSEPGVLYNESGSSKKDFIDIIVSSREFHEGCIIWAFNSLLARNPDSEETYALIKEFWVDKDFQKVQREIMLTDEYANFN